MLECAEVCLPQGKMTVDVQLLKTQPRLARTERASRKIKGFKKKI